MVQIGLIGYGYWGKNYVATLRDMPSIRTRWVCDSQSRPEEILNQLPARFSREYSEVLKDKETEAVIIATPASTHYQIGRDALKRGKHVLIEKPIARTVREAEALVCLAKKAGKILMVGHTFMYNPGINYVKDEVEKGAIGRIRYIDIRRVNPGPIRQDVNVVWDLGTHDIYLSIYLADRLPRTVSYQGASFNGKLDDVGNIFLKFEGNLSANIHNNWIHPKKERQCIVGGEKGALVFDDTLPAHKVTLYKMGVDFQPAESGIGAFHSAITSGDIIIPRISFKQPLMEEIQHFVDCIKGQAVCKSSGTNGLDVLRVLEAADKSRLAKGLEVLVV